MPNKTIVVLGATGTQGRAVLNHFLASKDKASVLKGVTRNKTSNAAQELQACGVEIVVADLDNVESLKHALKGDTHIFANTDSNRIIFDVAKKPEMLSPGQTPTEYAKEIELRYGKNLHQALLATDSVVRIVWSSLTSPKKWSAGEYKRVTMFDAKEEIADMLLADEVLRSKLSILLVGFYATNALHVPQLYAPHQQRDGSYKLSFPMPGHVPVPFADVESDIGKWVNALFELPSGQILIGASDWHTWGDWIRLWSVSNAVAGFYEETSVEAYSAKEPTCISPAVAEEFQFIGRFGFAGGNKAVVKPSDLATFGLDLRGTKLEDFIRSCDWSSLH